MQVSTRERNILTLAGIVAVIFIGTAIFPVIRAAYQERQEAIEDLLGTGSLDHFKSSITENLPANNAASLVLLENWCNLVFNSSNTNY